MSDLRVEEWDVTRLVPYDNNPRKNDHAVGKMADAIREFGFRIPVLARSDGSLIDGHLRLKAALSLGMERIPVIVADDMTPEQVRAFRVLVNRSATWAEWDEEKLISELRALQLAEVDLGITGFDQRELDALLMDMVRDGKDADAVPKEPEKSRVSAGEVWLLGQHRLLCGDSTSIDDMQRLMDGSLADMVWTDPPYNVDYAGKAGKIKNDKMSPECFDAFLLAAHRVMAEAVSPGGGVYVAHSEAGDGMAFRRAFVAAGLKLAACLVWRKQAAVLGRSDYQFQHEPILYGWKTGAAHRWYGDRKQRSVMEFDLDGLVSMPDGTYQLQLDGKVYQLSGDVQMADVETSVFCVPKPVKSELHPTTKPVALIERMIANSSPRGGLVLDPFGGSGSTLIACERLGRRCVTMELDPRYAEVIVRRFEEYTGVTATREDGATLSSINPQEPLPC